MTQLPNVDIIIANYNQGKFAQRCLDSVLKQDYPHDLLKVTIIDDGSTDGSRFEIQKATKILDTHIQYEIVYKTNGGTASARNKGLNKTNNAVVAFLDIDDEYLPNKISTSVIELLRYPKTGVIYSDYIEVFLDKKIVNAKPSFNKKDLLMSCMVSTNSIYLREAIDYIGEFDESVKGVEDYDSYLRIVNAGYMIRHIPEILFIYHQHGQNKTTVSNKEKWNKEVQFVVERAIEGTVYVKNDRPK